MRITTSGLNSELITQLQQLASQQNSLQNEVSTGLSVSQPADDPEAVSQVVADQMQESSLIQAGLNASTALADSQTTSASLTQIKSIADSASQVALADVGPTSMQADSIEVNQLLEQAVAAGNTTSGGNYIFAGTAVTTPPFTVTRDPVSGQITAVAYSGATTSASVPLGDGSSVQPSTDPATNANLATFMNQLLTLRNSLQAGDAPTVQATAASLADSDDTIVNAISDQAAVQSRIQIVQTQQQAQLTNLGQQVSTATSANLPTVVINLNQASESYQALLDAASKFMNVSLLDYIH
jgi:flagellar hook-associated protein 3 FlgL